jgi:cytochrome c biogenesis protein CcdA/glutaredoxin
MPPKQVTLMFRPGQATRPGLSGWLASVMTFMAMAAALAVAPAVAGEPADQGGQGVSEAAPGLVMYVFMSETCPHCRAQKPFLEALERKTPGLEIRQMEIMTAREHRPLLQAMAAAHDIRPGTVPMIFLGGRVWTGDSDQVRAEVSAKVKACLEHGCPDSRELIESRREQAPGGEIAEADAVIDLPLVGKVNLSVQPLLLSTSLIAFVDGFNPCSIWVLTMLLMLVLHSGSRRRVMLVGLTFLFTTAAIYGMFIAGVFSVLAFAAYLPWIYWIVALFALTFGLVNVKDYFWFKRGFSFTIDDKHKPGIFKGFRELMMNGRSPLALMGATMLMAAGIALIELPCTAGFPVIWSGLVRAHGVSWLEFLLLLSVYLLIYLLIELVIFTIAVVKLRIDRFQDFHGRLLKLVGGVIMVALAIVLIAAPEMMSQAGSAIGVFVVAFAMAGLIFLAHRYALPWVGIRVGDGW